MGSLPLPPDKLLALARFLNSHSHLLPSELVDLPSQLGIPPPLLSLAPQSTPPPPPPPLSRTFNVRAPILQVQLAETLQSRERRLRALESQLQLQENALLAREAEFSRRWPGSRGSEHPVERNLGDDEVEERRDDNNPTYPPDEIEVERHSAAVPDVDADVAQGPDLFNAVGDVDADMDEDKDVDANVVEDKDEDVEANVVEDEDVDVDEDKDVDANVVEDVDEDVDEDEDNENLEVNRQDHDTEARSGDGEYLHNLCDQDVDQDVEYIDQDVDQNPENVDLTSESLPNTHLLRPGIKDRSPFCSPFIQSSLQDLLSQSSLTVKASSFKNLDTKAGEDDLSDLTDEDDTLYNEDTPFSRGTSVTEVPEDSLGYTSTGLTKNKANETEEGGHEDWDSWWEDQANGTSRSGKRGREDEDLSNENYQQGDDDDVEENNQTGDDEDPRDGNYQPGGDPPRAHRGGCSRGGVNVAAHKKRKVSHFNAEGADEGADDDAQVSEPFLESSNPAEPNPEILAAASSLLIEISTGKGTRVDTPENEAWIQKLKAIVQGLEWDAPNYFESNSLFNLAKRCSQSDAVEVGVTFTKMSCPELMIFSILLLQRIHHQLRL
ncbi:hypothetical protein EV361DRAFT_955725 [Lentinula raphanica]|nr:hypothetical protein EV361DRAFT_955725 [Lentinula raphanica]